VCFGSFMLVLFTLQKFLSNLFDDDSQLAYGKLKAISGSGLGLWSTYTDILNAISSLLLFPIFCLCLPNVIATPVPLSPLFLLCVMFLVTCYIYCFTVSCVFSSHVISNELLSVILSYLCLTYAKLSLEADRGDAQWEAVRRIGWHWAWLQIHTFAACKSDFPACFGHK
jgi:hypothetical protein